MSQENPKPLVFSAEEERAFRSALGATQNKVMQRDPINFEELDKLQVELKNFSDNLLKKYPNAQNYIAFHIIRGSSVDPNITPIPEDFPGEYSVKKFLTDLIERYK